MKKTLLFVFLFASSISFAQLFEENFDYSAGTLSTVCLSNWVISSGTTEANVVEGNLEYLSYPSSGSGRELQVSNTLTVDYYHGLGTISSGSVYYSFLINVTNETGLAGNTAAGAYCMHFDVSASSALLFVRKGANSTKFQIGIAKKTSSTTQYLTSNELTYGQTYLFVISYTFNSSSTTDDVVRLWINPSLSGLIPDPDISFTDTQTDVTSITRACIRQSTNTPNAYIDGIRVATDWSQAPLPVEFTSFTSEVSGKKVFLNWATATEVNNYGFDVERKSENADWMKIGFVEGNGNSNSPKSYSFTDEPKGGREFKYRLKQIDLDGSYEYSDVVTALLENVSEFVLDQNFPNPFNPVTRISYTLPERASVRLKVYDMLAKEVSELVNGYQEAGRYEVTFDGSSLSSGTYFYKLEAGSFVEVKKLVLIK